MRLVQPNDSQQKRMKQLHWDAVRQADGMVWRELAASTQLDVVELERLFKLLDNNGTKCVSDLHACAHACRGKGHFLIPSLLATCGASLSLNPLLAVVLLVDRVIICSAHTHP